MIYWQLFIEFLKIGIFAFGGAYAIIPLIEETCVKNMWITKETLLDFIGISESTPGPISINMATLVGLSQGGVLGAIIATFAVVLPAFIITILIASILKKYIKNDKVQAVLSGIKPVIIALIIFVGFSMLVTICFPESVISALSLAIVLILFLINFIYKHFKKTDMPPLLIILIASSLGLVFLL